MTAVSTLRAGPPTLPLAAMNFCLYAPIGIQLAFLPIWLNARGLTSDQIGVIVALPSLAVVVASAPICRIADRTGQIAWTGAIAALASVAAYLALLQAESFLAIAILFGAAMIARAPATSLCDAIIVHAVRRDPRLDYSRTRLGGSFAVLAIMAFGGPMVGLVTADGIAWLMLGLAVLAAVAAVVTAIVWQPIRPEPGAPAADVHVPRPRLLVAVIAAAALIQGAHAMLYAFGALHWRGQGASQDFVGLAFAAGVAAEIVFFFFARRLLGGENRAGLYLCIGAGAAVLRWIGFAADPPLWAVPMLMAMHALTFGATHLGAIYLVMRLTPDGLRATAQGWMSATQALTTAGFALASGPVYRLMGESAYLVMALSAALGLALALLASRRAG